MRFRCPCGNTITNTTDCLPYVAHVVADVDIESYWEAWERTGRGQSLGVLLHPMEYEQIIYQCEECGRLFFDDPEDPRKFISFAPEGKNSMVTGPIEGERWKGYIYGYSDLGMERSTGFCYTTWNNGTSCENHSFDTFEEMKDYFDEKVAELKQRELLRAAWINKDGETVFRWNLEDDLPIQEKVEVYLTDEEALAMAKFKAAHKDCHHKFPKGSKGWDFSYEVLPGICGAYDRDLRITCLRCGTSLESVDGKILLRDNVNDASASAFEGAILDLIHERGSRDARVETINLPGRHHEIAEAIGYVCGLAGAAQILDPDTPIAEIAQRTFSKLLNDESILTNTEIRNLIRRSCDPDCFDWVIEDGLECLKDVLRDQYPNIAPNWIDEPKKERS